MTQENRFPLRHVGAALLACFALGAPTEAQITTFGVCSDGSQSGTGSTATSFSTVTLDTSTGAVTVSGSYSGLSSPQTVAHIHGSAPIGMTAGIVVTITGTGGTSGTLSASDTLTAPEMADMLAGLHYINIHSSLSPSGEIRGQVVQGINEDCPAELVTDPALVDNAGNSMIGPKIASTTETFNVSLDCSGAGGSGIYVIELRTGKANTPTPSPFGDLWCTGQKLFQCSGSHTQNTVTCFPGSGTVLPNDVSFIGFSYCIQGFCGDSTGPGRVSNGLAQTVGL